MKCWNNVADLLKHVEENYDNPTHLNYFQNCQWYHCSTQDVLSQIRYIALGLVSLGIKRGECVGLISVPSHRWMIVNFAVAIAGAVIVPIFPNIAEENFTFEFHQAKVKTVFVLEEDNQNNIEQHRDLFDTIISLDGARAGNGVLTYTQLLEKGQGLELENPSLYEELCSQIKNEDLVAIIYTSGTTGVPKGVMHTHQSLIRHLYDKPVAITPIETRYLNILPLAHIFGYTLNLALFGWGGSLYYWNEPRHMAKACQMVHPTVLAVVPRILERVYAKILTSIQQSGFMRRQIGQWAFDLANEEHQTLYKKIMHPIADQLLYNTLRENLGGKIELIISGGAALDPHINHFFNDIGVPVCQGWGLTEGCPICLNRLEDNKIGTVGLPLENLQVKISPEGEVLFKGTASMKGYYCMPGETKETLDPEGWLHTGDKGSIDAEGHLTLTGRIKELFKTSTGEYVAPIPIEQAFSKAPLIEAAMVIAEGRKYVTALLFANKDVLDHLKMTRHLQNMSDGDFLESDFVKNEMKVLIDNINEHLNSWEKIQEYRFISHAPSIESGECTPTLKLRREVIMKNHQSLIDSMYREAAKV